MFKKGVKGAREYPYNASTVEEAKIHRNRAFGKKAKTTGDNRCFPVAYRVLHEQWKLQNEIGNCRSKFPLKKASIKA